MDTTSERTETVRVIGAFDNPFDAERARNHLDSIGVAPEDTAIVTRDPREGPGEDRAGRSEVAAAALTGAVLGALVGGLLGWMIRIGALPLPGVGIVGNPGFGAAPANNVLATTVAGLIFGAGLGALIGALAGLIWSRPGTEDVRALPEGHVLLNVAASPLDQMQIESVLRGSGAYRVEGLTPSAESETLEGHYDGPAPEEERSMDEDEYETGKDPDTITGTQGAVDPETGTYGTGGTPLTTGHGASGSTVGTGSAAGSEVHEEGDFARATPDSRAYDAGGRASDDMETGKPGAISSVPAVERNADRGDIPASPAPSADAHDIYGAGPAYGPTTEAPSETPVTSYYTDAAVETGPTDPRVSSQGTEASEGTNIPGTEDPRGLGDNTDEPPPMRRMRRVRTD